MSGISTTPYKKNKKVDMDGLSTMQYFLKLLNDHEYFHSERLEEGTNNLGDVFFAHPHSVKLLRLFPYVLELDATYSTNRYEMPMVEVIGFLPTGKNFHVAFAFIKNEKEDSYLWIMRLLSRFFEGIKPPGVIVTDRELALTNSIHKVFPDAKTWLCRRHIGMDVQAKHVNLVGNKDFEWAVKARWSKVVKAKTEEEYDLYVGEILHAWRRLPAFKEYLKKTWLFLFHTHFVAYWTDQHLHLGALTTNRYNYCSFYSTLLICKISYIYHIITCRVESAHSQVKSWIRSSRANFPTIFQKIHEIHELDLNAIRSDFELNKTKHLLHCRRFMLFRRLGGVVSHDGIKLLFEEMKHNPDPSNCTHVIRATYGLPCACEMTRLIGQNMPIDPIDIHPFWKSLDVDAERDWGDSGRASADDLCDDAFKDFKEFATDAQKRMLAEYIHQQKFPDAINIDEPLHHKHKGRPPKAQGQRYKSHYEKS